MPRWAELPHPFISFRILLAALLLFPSPNVGSAAATAVPSAASSVLPLTPACKDAGAPWADGAGVVTVPSTMFGDI